MSERTRIDRLIEDVLACAPEERDAFLDAACEGNVALRSEIASLLKQASRANSFLEQPAAVPSLVGRTFGAYRIDAAIGAGGMGEVYRARDTKLGRDVAIKILPAFLAQDPDRLARLGREARTLAALNHPHIGSIYGIEEADGIRGLVLELVDGETLADRIAKGPLAIGEAVRIAGQIAEALAAAHAKGIVHRDLKPANIKITTGGSVKVLDFGLATADADESEGTTLATRVGSVMGTPAYMSPEQARGEAVGPQTDIWAFGCVLYEMLTARRAFGGATASDCIAAILKADPDWTPMPASTPAAVRTLLARCLAKDRARRLHSIADAQFDLGSALDGPTPLARTKQWPAWMKWSLAAALSLAVGVAGYLYGAWGDVATAVQSYHVDVDFPAGTGPWAGLAISPDGQTLVVSITEAGARRLIIRCFDQLTGWQDLHGGDGGEYPFFSPDGKQLAFFTEGKLVRVEPPSGTPVVVCDVVGGRGGVWLEDGTIVFAGTSGPLMRVDPRKGAPAVFLPLEEGQISLRYPVLAGPGRLLYSAGYADSTRSELRVIGLDAPQRFTTIMKTSESGVFDRGYLFYDRDGFTVAQRFDPSTGQLQGEPVRITREVARGAGHLGYLPLAAGGGHIAVAMIARAERQLAWRTPRGEPADNLGDPVEQSEFDLSPDGKRLAISRRAPNQIDRNIWIVDTRSGASRRVTSGWNDYGPVWSRDGRRIAFTSTRGLGNNLYMLDADNPQGEIPLVERDASLNAIGWVGDKRFVWSMVTTLDLDPTKYGIFTSSPGAGPREPAAPFRVGERMENARLSPDGTRIAYTSSTTGKPEVYVDTFPRPSKPVRISDAGGHSPRWHPDGRELYFVSGQELMVVAAPRQSGAPFGDPAWVLRLPGPSRWYAVDATSRILVLLPTSSPPPSLKLTFNWFSSQAARD